MPLSHESLGVKEDAEIIVVYGGKAIARARRLFNTRAKPCVTNRTIPWNYSQVVARISDVKMISRGPTPLSMDADLKMAIDKYGDNVLIAEEGGGQCSLAGTRRDPFCGGPERRPHGSEEAGRRNVRQLNATQGRSRRRCGSGRRRHGFAASLGAAAVRDTVWRSEPKSSVEFPGV